MSLAQKDRSTARKKGLVAGAATVGSIALMTASPIVGIVALLPTAYLVKDWFMFRARRGMRF
jgi:hypothetical protein